MSKTWPLHNDIIDQWGLVNESLAIWGMLLKGTLRLWCLFLFASQYFAVLNATASQTTGPNIHALYL